MKMRRLIFILLAVCAAAVLSVVCLAADPALLGSGTEEHPYIISNYGDWNIFADYVNANGVTSDKYFKLSDDFNNSQNPVSSIVGISEVTPFCGIFDGNGKTLNVSLTIDKHALSYYDDRSSQWTAEPGDFEALIGTSSSAIVSICGFRLKGGQ